MYDNDVKFLPFYTIIMFITIFTKVEWSEEMDGQYNGLFDKIK